MEWHDPTTFDVLKFAQRVRKTHRELYPAAQAFLHLASRRRDISDTIRVVAAGSHYMSGVSSDSAGKISNVDDEILRSCFSHSVFLYARGTDPKGSRASISLDKLEANDMELHREVRLIRDKAMAHHIEGIKFADGDMFNERVLCKYDKTGDVVAAEVWTHIQRVSFRGRINGALPALCEKINAIIDVKIAEVRRPVDQMIGDILAGGGFEEAIAGCIVSDVTTVVPLTSYYAPFIKKQTDG